MRFFCYININKTKGNYMYKIYNEDCLLTMKNHIEEKSIDIILTSPPYNITNPSKITSNSL